MTPGRPRRCRKAVVSCSIVTLLPGGFLPFLWGNVLNYSWTVPNPDSPEGGSEEQRLRRDWGGGDTGLGTAAWPRSSTSCCPSC